MLSRRAIAWAVALGALIGVASVASPATLWFLLFAALLLRWAVSDLEGDERRHVAAVLGIAVLARVLVICLVYWVTRSDSLSFGVLIGDEKFLQWRGLWLRNVALGIPIAPEDWANAYGAYGESGLSYAYAFVHLILGPSPDALRLLNTLLFLLGTVLMFKMIRRAYGSQAGLTLLLILCFLPSLFVWSISALKESAFFCLTAMSMVSMYTLGRTRSWVVRAACIAGMVFAVNAVSTVRVLGRFLAVVGLGAGVALRVVTLRAWLAVAAIGIAAAAGAMVFTTPALQQRVVQALQIPIITHLGNVYTTGYGYHLLDSYFYSRWMRVNDLSFMTFPEAVRYLLRAIMSFVVVPLPWQATSRPALAFLPQQMFWLLAAGLALIGVVEGARRDWWATCLLCGFCVVAAGVISIASGNIGTFIRMRDMAVPFVLCLSALGACYAADRVMKLVRPSKDAMYASR